MWQCVDSYIGLVTLVAIVYNTGPKFPEKAVNTWNTNDHGVNNAEGAIRWSVPCWRA